MATVGVRDVLPGWVFHAGLAVLMAGGRSSVAATEPVGPAMRQSEVVFMYAASDEAYRAYGATLVAWGGAEKADQVKRHHDLGIRCTGSMWCLTAGAENIHKDPNLRAACAVDIEGRPVDVPWQFDQTFEGTKTGFGCTNHPAFRRLCAERVRQAMAGGAEGLHVDDHLGTAGAAWWQGGGFCDYCMQGFRDYLRTHASREQLQKAGVQQIDGFDYRTVVRRFATTREQYKKVQRQIPLMDLFLEFHAEAAAEHTRQLGELASQVAGHPVLLSANAGLPNKAHTHVVKYLTHIVCEVGQNAPQGTAKIDEAVEAYRLATELGKPMAATASGWDWAFVKQNQCEDLVRFWIALAYSHGQRFMVPHPRQQWCFNNELGTHWYAAPAEAYTPVYRFISENAQWFDGFEAVDAKDRRPAVPANALCTVRRKKGTNQVVLHLVNRDYNTQTKAMNAATNVEVRLDKALASPTQSKARILSYDGPSQQVELVRQGDAISVTIPELRLWSLVVID